ncbi:LPS export ABC transporter periplasmic protein LptC [Thermomonas sp.]|uniref:LPS export ABC transporter periplasmic protein LptC n=1 Tax=Thermomonas sp. TaxID=1971895 RepID=UPI00260FF085|nr:LPS export ABC transporter periplasmic protein LptC [Thermomonas sp.]HRO62789.1 LPS export ABC transporter periplasmic protein LptC [Thermomonas sp.]
MSIHETARAFAPAGPRMSWRATLTLLLLAAAIASGWSVWRNSRPVDEGVLRSRPDYLLRDYEITSLDKQGKEQFTLRGPILQRDPADLAMHLATPQFLVPDPEGHYWEVRADEGLVPAGGDSLEVRGRVSAQSPADKPPVTRIESDQLTLDLEHNRATSAGKVTITRPGLTMEGTGLLADFERRQISLLSQVHNRYDPKP